jgi:hypothetical protein
LYFIFARCQSCATKNCSGRGSDLCGAPVGAKFMLELRGVRLISSDALARHIPLRVLLLDDKRAITDLTFARASSMANDLLHAAHALVAIVRELRGSGLVFGNEGSAFSIKVDQRNCLRACGVSNVLQKTRLSERRQSIPREEYASTWVSRVFEVIQLRPDVREWLGRRMVGVALDSGTIPPRGQLAGDWLIAE